MTHGIDGDSVKVWEVHAVLPLFSSNRASGANSVDRIVVAEFR
jgi:hypothetical protein